MASRLDVVGTTEANAFPQLVLTTSPAIIAIGNGSTVVQVVNGTGAVVPIVSVSLQNPVNGQVIVPYAGVNCVQGLILQVNALCYVQVNAGT